MNYQYKPVKIYFDITTGHQTLSECVKDLIETSYKIYSDLLSKNIPITIICGGQSPAYYCLAMMNLTIFKPENVNIIILPHSKFGIKSKNQLNENMLYCKRLKEKNIQLRKNVVIIDTIHTGTGILALESSLKYYSPSINIIKLGINHNSSIIEIKVDKVYISHAIPKFSDEFPRLVMKYYPENFNDSSKFITEFINLSSNLIAKMVIDIAKVYPKISVENTMWYKLNNIITPKIRANKIIYKNNIMLKLKQKSGYFIPIILDNPKRYQCPLCKSISGTKAITYPNKIKNYFIHDSYCLNKNKLPKVY